MENTQVNFFNRYAEYILVTLFVIIALFTFKQYGISWDEVTQHKTGTINYNYVFNDNPYLLEWKDRDYGVAFELPLVIIEKTLNLTDSRDIFLMRHLVTHLFFLLGAFFLFKLIHFLYNNKLLATIGFLLLVLHPRIYGHSFFNSKDIPFLALFIISLYYTAIAFHKKSVKNFIILGVCIGLLINMRIMGVILPFFIGLFLIIDALKEKDIPKHLKYAASLLVVSCLVLYISWPYLWTNPIGHFIESFENMSKFRWGGSVLFNGELIKARNVGPFYIPVWFSLTTPLFFLISGLLSAIFLGIRFIKKPFQFIYNTKQRNHLLFAICCFAPILAVILLKSVLYDGWRQLYFIYPGFVLLAVYGINYLLNSSFKKVTIGLSVLSFVLIAVFMLRNFPFQHVYFNQLTPKRNYEELRKNYEMDYWGTAYKQSLEHLLKTDDSPILNISVANFAGEQSVKILHEQDRKRINIVPLEKATYFITNYRFHPEDYSELNAEKVHSIKVYNNSINSIYKLK